MSSRIEKAEECVWVSHIATIGHTPLQPFIKKKRKKKKSKVSVSAGSGWDGARFLYASPERGGGKGGCLWL